MACYIYPCANCKNGNTPETYIDISGVKQKFYPTKCNKGKIIGDKQCPDFEESNEYTLPDKEEG